jgi:hypothetical protein
MKLDAAGNAKKRQASEAVSDSSREQLTACLQSSITSIRGVERDQPGNFLGSVNQRFGEFGPEILGFEANLQGSSRTSMDLLRTRESGATPAIDVNACGKGGKRETPGDGSLGVRRQLVCRF